MAFDSFQEFIAMGGHARYVWSAWGLTAMLLVVAVLHARFERRQVLRQLRRRVRREAQQAGRSGETQPIQTSRGGSANEA